MFLSSTVELMPMTRYVASPRRRAGRAAARAGRGAAHRHQPWLETLYSAAAINLNILNFSSSASSHNSAHSGAADSFPRVQNIAVAVAALLAAGQSSPVQAASLF